MLYGQSTNCEHIQIFHAYFLEEYWIVEHIFIKSYVTKMDVTKKEKHLEVFSVSSQLPENKKVTTKALWWHIDKEMVRFKIHYLLFVGGLGTSLPYLTIFAKNRIGLSASSLAAILTTQQFLFIFTKPLMGYLADYFNKLKATIAVLTVVPTVFLFLLLPIPKINNFQTEENTPKTHILPLLNVTNVFSQNENCKFSSESDTTLRNEFRSSIVCSFESYDEIHNNCFKITLSQMNSTILNSNINFVDTRNNSMYNLNGIKNMKDLKVLCSFCFNTTEECYFISCADNTKRFDETKQEVTQFETYQFWVFAIILTIAMASLNALFTLSDTACCESIAKTGADFGRQRLYAAIGWGGMAPIGGLLRDYTDDYLPGWIIMGIMLAMSLWNLWKIDMVQPQFSKNILKDVGEVLSSAEFLAFELGVFLNGIGCGIIWFYQVWFLTTIGASRFLCGLVQTVQCFVGEIPFMFFSGWFIKKLGHFNVLSLSLAAYSARFFFYSYLENPWLILPMEVVHGLTYGIFYAAVASFAKLSAKPGTEATTQSILFSTQEGLGAGLGCVIAGLGFDTFGGHETFYYASIFSGCGMVVNMAFTLWSKRQQKSINVTYSK